MGTFITFEGGDGAGKSTQIRLLEAYCIDQGRSCLTTREPGGTSLGQVLRQTLLESEAGSVGSTAELFLYLADRAQHVREIIEPALAQGKVVLCDRYADSTVAYQGYGRGIDRQLLVKLNEIACDGLKPDITFLLDCAVELGLSRTAQRGPNVTAGAGKDRFESEKWDFHERVRRGFLELARAEPDRFHIVDASRSEQEVFAAIKQIVDKKLGVLS